MPDGFEPPSAALVPGPVTAGEAGEYVAAWDDPALRAATVPVIALAPALIVGFRGAELTRERAEALADRWAEKHEPGRPVTPLYSPGQDELAERRLGVHGTCRDCRSDDLPVAAGRCRFCAELAALRRPRMTAARSRWRLALARPRTAPALARLHVVAALLLAIVTVALVITDAPGPLIALAAMAAGARLAAGMMS